MMRYSKVVLTIMLAFLLTYTIGVEPSTLTACVYGFCGVEGGLMAWLKVVERKNKGKDDPND